MGAAAILIPILADIGAPLLKGILQNALPDGLGKDMSGAVVDTIASKLGVPATPEAIADKYKEDPAAVTAAVQAVEANFGPKWAGDALAGRDALLAREDTKGFFHNGWRPAMSWLQIWLWLWNTTLRPLVNSATGASLPEVPYDVLVSFAGIWLVIYGGGHTVKSVFGK